jgi:tetratricopeptide (TPR) repeat protein
VRRVQLSKRVLLCVAVLIAVGAGSQAPPPGWTPTAYRQLVDDYRHQIAASAQRVGALPEIEIRRLVDDALNPRGEAASWTSDTLLAAAMLHTDVCLDLLVSGNTNAAFVHLNAAIRLVEAAVLRDRSSQTLAGLWYRTVPPILIKLGAQVWGDALIKRSQPVIDQSAGDAAFARGLDMEVVACEVDPGVPVDGFGLRLSTPLRAAVAGFEEALRRDPSLHKAALHLGRSRLLLSALDDARRWLEAATRSPLVSDRYLALLYLGSMEEQEGRLDQAEARYRAATSAFPWGQSGPLALARLLSRTNREAESRAVVSGMLEQRYVVDPLWTYLAKPGSEPGAFLDLIRAEIWQ